MVLAATILDGNQPKSDYYSRSSGFCAACCGGDRIHDHRPSITGRTSVAWLEPGNACREGPGILDSLETSRIGERAARVRIYPRSGAPRPGSQWHRPAHDGQGRRRDGHARRDRRGSKQAPVKLDGAVATTNVAGARPCDSAVIVLELRQSRTDTFHIPPDHRYILRWGR